VLADAVNAGADDVPAEAQAAMLAAVAKVTIAVAKRKRMFIDDCSFAEAVRALRPTKRLE
jgi:hypothetical protein